MTTGSPLLSTYLALTHLADRPYRWIQKRRAKAGKEDPNRLEERQGIARAPRPPGRLVWFHAASVGETQALLPLIGHLLETHADLSVLVTSTTLTSAGLLARDLPDRAWHQFPPFDTPRATRAFLSHWRPDVAVFAESELWPRLLSETRAGRVPLLLVNARISERTAARWRGWPRTARALLAPFDRILVQEERTAALMKEVGVAGTRIAVTGSIKEDTPAPDADPGTLEILRTAIGPRGAWCAASTHPGEDEIVLAAHEIAFGRSPQAPLLILVPRHPDRGPSLAEMIAGAGWRVALRSKGDMPTSETQVYIADTLGEMGLWYRLAPVSFVAGSLTETGGHNPFEPVQLGSAVVHGPHVFNFRDIYDRLAKAEGALAVTGTGDLAAALVRLTETGERDQMAERAHSAVRDGGRATELTLREIEAVLPPV